MTILQHILARGMSRWKSLPIVLRRRLVVGALSLFGVDCLLIVIHEPLLIWFAYQFKTEDPLTQSDAIIMLIGGPFDRPDRAAEIYRQGLAPIIFMGLDSSEMETGVALIQSQVPADAVAVLPGAAVNSTYDEALRVRDYVRNHSMRRIIVVTTSYHSARTRWIFRRVLRSLGVEVRMAVSRDPRFTETDWFKCRIGLRTYLIESIKYLYYRLAY
jgi:uncharacterized SAM-binding protein YcdF (DUF218 family)